MMSLSALVLGSTGMLGRTVFRALSARADWKVTGTQRFDSSAPNYVNAAHPVESWISLIQRYDYIVNCIGILKQDVNETDAASMRKAISVNSLFPNYLAEAAASAGARVIHMSTDGVFSGASKIPYVETDPTDCADLYAKTKALGECMADNVVNIRCSIVGRDPLRQKGLIEWLLNAPEGSELPGFDDQIWAGVTTVQFAALCRGILELGHFDQIRAVSGVYHFAPNPPISKYELLCAIQRAAKKDIKIKRTRSGFPTTRVLSTRFTELTAIYQGTCSWPEAIHQIIEETELN
jgi:dTDP-4-dehydrorhamnose reductase